MSKDKRKSIDRFYDLFTRGNQRDYSLYFSPLRITKTVFSRNKALNCEGGVGYDNDIIQWGLKKNFLELKRNSHPKWCKMFDYIWRQNGYINGNAYRTIACLTPAGRLFIEKEMKRRNEFEGMKINVRI